MTIEEEMIDEEALDELLDDGDQRIKGYEAMLNRLHEKDIMACEEPFISNDDIHIQDEHAVLVHEEESR